MVSTRTHRVTRSLEEDPYTSCLYAHRVHVVYCTSTVVVGIVEFRCLGFTGACLTHILDTIVVCYLGMCLYLMREGGRVLLGGDKERKGFEVWG